MFYALCLYPWSCIWRSRMVEDEAAAQAACDAHVANEAVTVDAS